MDFRFSCLGAARNRFQKKEERRIAKKKKDFQLSYLVKNWDDTDTVKYWKQRALNLEKLLELSVNREQILLEKLEESIEKLEKQSSPVEELSQILKRADNFLHFVLQNAPVVIGHQDKDLRYRFIYNHFPSLGEEDIIGKTDVEIFKGGGVKESQDFKREVLEKGIPGKREITFETELFGANFGRKCSLVIGDVLRIRQILTNLIRSSKKSVSEEGRKKNSKKKRFSETNNILDFVWEQQGKRFSKEGRKKNSK
ncbi:histidine kinase 5-like [Lactuca sativa]|uniref:histidine kinase 5-like n=1 Tax=Lactuca sativa TaxID=4236 RepID=UPI0022AEE41F|nr:histidine kinase 5-like [Lactuca sativa]